LKILDKIEANSEQHHFKTITGIPSGPEALEASSLEITSETSLGVMRTESMEFEVLSGKSGGICPESSRVEFLEKRLAKRLALSDEEVRTSGPLKRGGIEDLPQFKILFEIHQKSRKPMR